MRKHLIFAIPMILIGFALFMLEKTGLTAHIILSLVGLVLVVAYTIVVKTDWRLPIVEIVMRVFYLIALITGVIVMNVTGVVALSVIHKISAALFIVLFAFLLVHKATKRHV